MHYAKGGFKKIQNKHKMCLRCSTLIVPNRIVFICCFDACKECKINSQTLKGRVYIKV